MQAWRIGFCPTPVPGQARLLSGLAYGSTLASGRWHRQGVASVVYAGSSRALCQLEKRVHANGAQPRDQALMRLELPAAAELLRVEERGLAEAWMSDKALTQRLGIEWLMAMDSLVLSVPSFVEPMERNLLINPLHPLFGQIRVVIERHPFRFDQRLF